MKFRSTWIMSALVIGIGVYTAYDYKKSLGSSMMAENERLAFELTPSEVTALTVLRGTETIVITKVGEVWQMTEPLKDLADTGSVQGFIYTLLAERVRTFRVDDDAKKEPDWVATGLDKPAVTIEVTGKGRTESISISTKNAFDGSFYIREKDELLLGDAGFAQLRDRLASSFRSRRLWREDAMPIVVDFNTDGKEYKLSKWEGNWQLDPHTDFELDDEKIDKWLERIQEFSPSYLEKDGITNDDRRSYLLLKPSFIFRAGDWTLTAGQDRGEDVFVYTNKRDTLYKTSQGGLSEIRVKPEFFRNLRKAFAFPLEQVTKVEITTGDKKRVITKTGSDWSLPAEDTKDFDLDMNKLTAFFQNIRSLSGKASFAKGEGFPTTPQISMRDSQGKEIFSLAWGASIPGKSDVFVKTNLEKDVMSLSKEKIDELIPHEMVRKKK